MTAGAAGSSTAGGGTGGAAATGGAKLPSAAASSAARGDVACDPVIPAKGSVGVGCAVGGSAATELVSCVVNDVTEPLGGRDAVRAEATGADTGGAAMAGGRDTDLGAASMSPMPANGSLGAIIVGGGGVGSAAAASGKSGDVAGGGVAPNELDGGGGGGVRCCTGGGADAPATAAITPDAASEM
jgi:hypothetical protein